MPKDNAHLVADLTGSGTAGWLSSLLAEEDTFDRRVLWRLGTWAFCAVGALIAAVLAAQSSTDLRRERTAYAELTRQAQQIQWIAKDSQSETRRLSAAVDTLNNDRDRLYSRVTVMEQSLDSVTGAISKQASAMPPTPPSAPAASTSASATASSAPPSISPPPATAPVPLVDPAPDKKNDQKTPDTQKAADTKDSGKNPDTATSAAALSDIREMAAAKPVQRTDFGVDIGTANSVEGLRALWRGALGSQNALLGGLQPIIVVKERTDGFGLQLRLVAGPLADAATAARICARLTAIKHDCTTSVYDGQRLALGGDTPSAPAVNSHTSKQQRRKSGAKTSEAPAPSAPSGFTALFGAR